MQADFWHARWQQAQIGFHQGAVNPYLARHWPRLGLAPAARVLVPLCGKSLDMCWLRAQGHPVLGVELSPLAVQAFFREQRLAPVRSSEGAFQRFEADGVTLLCGDFFALAADALHDVSAVYDRAALVALPPAMRQAYAARLRQLLAAGSEMLLVAFEYPQQQMDGPPFSVSAAELDALFGGWCTIELLQREDILAAEPRFRERGVTQLHETVYRLRSR